MPLLKIISQIGIKIAAPLLCVPLAYGANMSLIESQNIRDEGSDFTIELKRLAACDLHEDTIKEYRAIVMQHHLLKNGRERHSFFQAGLQKPDAPIDPPSEYSCQRSIFSAGKRSQTMRVELAIENANEKFLTHTFIRAYSPTGFGMEIVRRISDPAVKCIPNFSDRQRLLAGFKPMLISYMQDRMGLPKGFEKGNTFGPDSLIDLMGYESDVPPETSPPSKVDCARDIFLAGSAVALVEQLKNLKADATGVWLDRRLRGGGR